MAASSSAIPTLSSASSLLSKPPLLHPSSPSRIAFKIFTGASRPLLHYAERSKHSEMLANAQTFEFYEPLFQAEFIDSEEPPSIPPWSISLTEDREEPQCPPGLRQYETMIILRPDVTEDERLTLTQKYEELLAAGGGMYVEVFNRGIVPLAYEIKKKNIAGESNTYWDGIYLLFTYFTKPESMAALSATLDADDDVIRSSTFKKRKRKY
ncbi:unnamed protein product [Cuscuta campestris]|uniref:Ribosomal protein S6 n=1 Tax=Cuscuta campestris TaxID=132261 RepID=A0A484KPN6_9ASTE|nr:unnamed protein product [Cuscuta campestris]